MLTPERIQLLQGFANGFRSGGEELLLQAQNDEQKEFARRMIQQAERIEKIISGRTTLQNVYSFLQDENNFFATMLGVAVPLTWLMGHDRRKEIVMNTRSLAETTGDTLSSWIETAEGFSSLAKWLPWVVAGVGGYWIYKKLK